jgi:hypothetical protein
MRARIERRIRNVYSMPMLYFLHSDQHDNELRRLSWIPNLDDKRDLLDALITGKPVQSGLLATPLILELDGPESAPLPIMFDLLPVMHENLISAVENLGIHNLECHPVVLKEPFSEKTYPGYRAVNVIGLVPTVPVQPEDVVPPTFQRVCDWAAVEEPDGIGLDVFRLEPMQLREYIVVTDQLRDRLQSDSRFTHLRFLDPNELVM